MLSREENELVTRIGQGTPMGNAMRRYWIPAAAIARGRRTGWAADTRPAAWRRSGRISRHRGPHRTDRRILPASPRIVVFWP